MLTLFLTKSVFLWSGWCGSLAGPVVFSGVPDHCLSPSMVRDSPQPLPWLTFILPQLEIEGNAPEHSVISVERVPVITCAPKSRLAAEWDALPVRGRDLAWVGC